MVEMVEMVEMVAVVVLPPPPPPPLRLPANKKGKTAALFSSSFIFYVQMMVLKNIKFTGTRPACPAIGPIGPI
eukprot:532876-Rhodomonas_salina.1